MPHVTWRGLFAMNIEPRYMNLSTFSKDSPSSGPVWRCSPGMGADITLVFDALMRMPTAETWWLTVSSSVFTGVWLALRID